MRFLGSIARMRFSRVSTMSTASSFASAPPDSPVPAPRGTNGTPSAASSRTTATTSSRLPGSTTTPGTRRWVGSPSRAYVIRSGSAVRTCRAPTISPSAAASDSPRPTRAPSPPPVTRRARSRGGGRHARCPAPVAAPPLGVGRDGTQHGRELAQPGAGAPARLQRLLRRRVELERRRDLEREELGIGRQLDLLVLSLREDAERARKAPEAVPHVCGEGGHLGGIGRIVVEFLDLGDPVRARARDPVPQYETTLANGEDIGTPVGERLVRLDEGDAADVARIRYGIGVRRGVGRHVGDPEPPVTGETVLQQLAVARLEDVQWLGGPGKQDNRQRKNGKFPRHGYILDAQTRRRTGVYSKKGPGSAFLTPAYCSPRCVCASSLCRSSSRPPKALEGPAVWRFPQLLKRPLPNLSDPFPRHSHQRPDLLERHGLAAFFEAVVEIEDLALTRGEILLEDAVDELAHQLAVRLLLDLPALLAREALAQRRCVLVAPVHRRVQRQLGRRHAARGAHVLDGVLERHRDLVVGRLPAELLRQVRLGAAHADELRVMIQRDADTAGLLGERLHVFFFQAEDGIRDELHALIGIELLHRLEQPLVPDGDQLGEVEAVPLILLDVGDDESEVGGDESLGGFFVAPLHASRQAALFSGIFDQWEFLDVLQILVEGTGRIGTKERLRLASVRPRHS